MVAQHADMQKSRLACTLFPVLVAITTFTGCSPGYFGRVPAHASAPGLTLLPITGFQQTTEYTCGPAIAKTLVAHAGRVVDEMTVAKEMSTNADIGTTPAAMAGWFERQGWKVTWGENGTIAEVRARLARSLPTLVEWSDWGGHWVLVVGYDTRGTEAFGDDVIIFADSSDCADDRVDGLTWCNAERFDFMWYDAVLFGKLMKRVYVAADPPPAAPAPDRGAGR